MIEKHLKVKEPEMNAKQTEIKQPWCITSSAKCRIRQRCYIWQLDQFAVVEFGNVVNLILLYHSSFNMYEIVYRNAWIGMRNAVNLSNIENKNKNW